MLRIFTAILFCMLAASAAPAQTARQVPQSRMEITLSYAPVVKRAAPAVVNVYAKTLVAQRETDMFADPFFRRFFGNDGSFGRPRERVKNSLGSGVIVDPSGVIVTNNHVVAGATELRVVLPDKREFEARILLTDERTDLAVLKIDMKGERLPALPFANSDDLEVGDLVLAIGNPFGVGQTVTSGIVSALARTRVGVTDYQFFIQTDAAINPGNSGGALVNMRGELVGINTAIFSKSGGSVGIGFSIPSNMVQTVVESAESGDGRIHRPWLGVQLQDVTSDIADSLGLARPEGALIAKLHPQSPLAAAGLKRGDVLIGFEGHAIESAQEFGFRVGTAKIGESRIVEFRRGDKDFEARLKMVAAPETTPRDEWTVKVDSPFAGLTVANLSPAVAEEVGMAAEAEGVVVTDVGNGPAQRFFKKGDMLLFVNRSEITKVQDLRDAVAAGPSSWSIGIGRDGKQLNIRLR
ncbi:MAG: DegQ family serine endoprotease [Rhizobiales bacterium]|nr:DegQ family serine endoprotease [Hyphomicrobiales bacterium]